MHLTDLSTPPWLCVVTVCSQSCACNRVLTPSTLCASQSLADRCAQKQGAFAARIREYEYREVVAANAEGERLIIIDGTKF